MRRELRADLDAIVLKALRKDSARRYPSVDAMAEELRRRQAGLPVSAASDALSYRLGKYLRRHRVAVTLGAVVLLSLVGGLAGTMWQARQAAREATTARAVTDFVLGIFKESDPSESLGRELSARDLMTRGRARLDTALRAQPAVRGELLGMLGVVNGEMGFYPQADTLLRQAIAITRASHGPDHPDVAARLTEWANTLVQSADFTRADSALRRAFAIRRSALGPNHPDVAETLVRLTDLEFELGTWPQRSRWRAGHSRSIAPTSAPAISTSPGTWGKSRRS